MNRKALAPLLLIPLILIALVGVYFLLKFLFAVLIQLALWTLGILFMGLIGFISYLILKKLIKRKR